MAKLIMWNLVSLDGCFEGTDSWSIDWFSLVFGDDFQQFILEQLRTADHLVFGRITYQGMAAHWQSATDDVAGLMNSLPKLVCSNTLAHADWNNTTLLRGDPILLGKGQRLFGDHPHRLPLNFLGSQTFTSGLNVLRYAPVHSTLNTE